MLIRDILLDGIGVQFETDKALIVSLWVKPWGTYKSIVQRNKYSAHKKLSSKVAKVFLGELDDVTDDGPPRPRTARLAAGWLCRHLSCWTDTFLSDIIA